MKNILLLPDGGAGASPPPAPKGPTVQEQLDAANARIAELTSQQQQTGETEKKISAKMALGLTRPQAISVIKRQAEYDASKISKERAQRKSGESLDVRKARAAKLLSKS
jgi:hypothetical protein